MISAVIWTLLLIALLFSSAWAMARVARAVGSPRGWIRVAFAAMGISFAVNASLEFLIALVFPNMPHSLLAGFSLLLLHLFIYGLVVERAFHLSLVRIAPIGAVVSVTITFLILAIGLIRPYITEAFVFPTRSMMPTLNPSDRTSGTGRLSISQTLESAPVPFPVPICPRPVPISRMRRTTGCRVNSGIFRTRITQARPAPNSLFAIWMALLLDLPRWKP